METEMPLYRFIFEKSSHEITATTLASAYENIVDFPPGHQAGKLIKVECNVEPFERARTLYVEETWDEWRYRLEIDEEAQNYEDVVHRLWINSRMDGTGYWVEMPHNYTNPVPSGRSDPTNAASIVEKYSDLYWRGGGE
jgi:hypothetical protein